MTKSHCNKWMPISSYEFLGFWAVAGFTFFLCLSGNHWFYILDDANLMFHEAGHPLIGFFSSHLSVYGGTFSQLLFPVICILKFFKTRSTTSYAFSFLWFFENLFNIARYMGDARAQQLPLVGGGNHDWTEILTRWHLLDRDTWLAANLKNFSIIGILIICYWIFSQWNNKRNVSGTNIKAH